MNKIIVIIVIILTAGGVGFALKNNKKEPAASQNTSQPTSQSTSEPEQQTTSEPQTAATKTNFTVNATDDSADVMTLNVKKGDKITVTFNVKQDGVYHGGLEFRSDVVSSGPIKPGGSKTVTFTADQSFDFIPYWYQSNVQKGYMISVKVM